MATYGKALRQAAWDRAHHDPVEAKRRTLAGLVANAAMTLRFGQLTPGSTNVLEALNFQQRLIGLYQIGDTAESLLARFDAGK